MPFASCNPYALKFPVLFSGFHVCLLPMEEARLLSCWTWQIWMGFSSRNVLKDSANLGLSGLPGHMLACTTPGWHRKLSSLAAPPSLSLLHRAGRKDVTTRNFSPQLGTLTATSQHLSPHVVQDHGSWCEDIQEHMVTSLPAHCGSPCLQRDPCGGPTLRVSGL